MLLGQPGISYSDYHGISSYEPQTNDTNDVNEDVVTMLMWALGFGMSLAGKVPKFKKKNVLWDVKLAIR